MRLGSVKIVLVVTGLAGCCVGAGGALAAPVPSDVPASLPGATLTIGQLTLNGQALEGLSCTGSFALFGPSPASVLAERGPALRACVSGAARPRVHFAFAGGVVSDVRVADAPAASACIAGVLSSMQPPGTGACVATVVLGP